MLVPLSKCSGFLGLYSKSKTMPRPTSFTVDDDFTMEVLEEDEQEEEYTVVTIQEEPEDPKPVQSIKDQKIESNGLAMPIETKKEFKHFFSNNYRQESYSTFDPTDKAALEFKTLSILREYKDMISEGFLKRPFECPICQYKTDRFSIMLTHVNNHLSHEKQYKCNVCNYVAFSKGNLTMHRARCDYKFKKSCPHCSYVTIRNKTFRKHLLIHSAKFKCASCKFYTDDNEQGKLHMKSCTKWKGVDDKCDFCDFQNEDEVVLAQHTQEKHPEYELKCGDCEFVTWRKKWLDKHRHESHRTLNAAYKCDQCYFSAFTKPLWRRHMKMHAKKK